MERINVTRSSMPTFEEYCEEIRILWDSRWLSNRGEKHREFESLLSEYLGVEEGHVKLFANGHVALEVCLDAFHLPKGSEIITSPYTHCSTTHSIVRNGLTPVFCDVRDDNYTIDTNQIERYITNKTKAIMATHVYGEICDVNRINKIASDYGLLVFYDAAHAFGETYIGKGVGSFGDFSMFSCHATKVFHTIEGGISSIKNHEVLNNIESMINFGFKGPEDVLCISTNARMNEFEAAMGICNLRYIDREIEKRSKVAKQYRDRLSGIKGIKMIGIDPNVKYNFSYMPVFFDGYRYSRDEIQIMLEKKNVFARKYFYPLVTELTCYIKQYGDTVQQTPVSKWAADHILTLPMYSDLSNEDVDRICDVIQGGVS